MSNQSMLVIGASLLCAAAGMATTANAQVKGGSSLPLWTNIIDVNAPQIGNYGQRGTCPCSGQTTPENEANCGIPDDTVNGGCNSVVPVYSTIALGQSICGTAQIGTNNLRDTDWYRFTLTQTTSIEWVVRAEFPVQLLVLADVCPGALQDPNAVANVPACTDGIIALQNLPPGSYIGFVSPQQGSPFFECNTGSNQYVATLRALEPRGACCVGGGCTPGLTASQCAGQGGVYQGNNSNCGDSSYTIAQGGSAFQSIAGSGTLAGVASTCDDCSEAVTIPFNFSFYGTPYTSVNVHSNGFLQFGAPFVAYVNDVIPSAAQPNNAIYPFWDDLNPLSAGNIYTTTTGTAPNRKFIVEWNAVTQYAATTSETFQAVLSEGTNGIEFRYGNVTPDVGGDYTIGVENDTGTVATSVPGTSIGAGNTSLQVTFVPGVNPCSGPACGTADFDGDGDVGTDADIEAFFACLGGNCCATCFPGGADFNGDGDTGTDADIEAFFRVLSGGNC